MLAICVRTVCVYLLVYMRTMCMSAPVCGEYVPTDRFGRRQGLQEFAELCDTLALEDVRAALPFWPRLYRKLATDVDR